MTLIDHLHRRRLECLRKAKRAKRYSTQQRNLGAARAYLVAMKAVMRESCKSGEAE